MKIQKLKAVSYIVKANDLNLIKSIYRKKVRYITI